MDYNPNLFLKRTLFIFIIMILGMPKGQSQSAEQQRAISNSYDQSKLDRLLKEFEDELERNKIRSKSYSQDKNWNIAIKQLDGTVVALNDFAEDGTPLYYTTFLDPTAKISRANTMHPEGLLNLDISGQDMKVGIWDAGIALGSHQEFDLRITNNDESIIDNHATLVTGTVVASGVKKKARGVAYDAHALCYDWSRDKAEVVAAAANGLLLSNHSYGIQPDRVPDWYFGSYLKISQDWDKVMYHAPYYLMVSAAGNARNSMDNQIPNFGRTADGYDLLLGFATAKNGLVVAGSTANIDRNGDIKSAKVAAYSSYGPTDDGRIKPDLAGDGTMVYSTASNSDTSYASSLGTSIAAPGVTGALLLLQQYHEELSGRFMRAATLKGLALHTADDVDKPGPDYKMGWGVMNSKKAAQLIKKREYHSLMIEDSLVQDNSYSITVEANGTEPLSASISWTDAVGDYVNRGEPNAAIPALTNDLDIRITKDGVTYFPWKLNPAKADLAATKGDNKVDPFERIDIMDATGTYTITVTHKNVLENGRQDFSLIVSGVRLSDCQLNAPKAPVLGDTEQNGLSLQWESVPDAIYELQYKKSGDDSWNMETLAKNHFNIEDVEMGVRYAARVRTVCSQNLASDFSDEVTLIYNGAETTIEQNQTLAADQLSLKVFPNPAVNEIQVSNENSKNAYFEVVSTAGTQVKSGELFKSIDVTDLSAGLYVLNVYDHEGIRSAKFVKN